MCDRASHAQWAGAYRLDVAFSDGASARLDFSEMAHWGGLWAPLKDLAFFRRARITEEGALEWPNGADVCPDLLYHIATGAPLPAGAYLDRQPGIRRLPSPRRRQAFGGKLQRRKTAPALRGANIAQT